jgi:hypothetical protein
MGNRPGRTRHGRVATANAARVLEPSVRLVQIESTALTDQTDQTDQTVRHVRTDRIAPSTVNGRSQTRNRTGSLIGATGKPRRASRPKRAKSPAPMLDDALVGVAVQTSQRVTFICVYTYDLTPLKLRC